jgi:hypothetical protein
LQQNINISYFQIDIDGKIMNIKIFIIPLAMLLLSAMMAPVLAQPELVGVQVGD